MRTNRVNYGPLTQWSTVKLLKKNEEDLREVIWTDFQDMLLNFLKSTKEYMQ